jgi:hypothetical protein
MDFPWHVLRVQPPTKLTTAETVCDTTLQKQFFFRNKQDLMAMAVRRLVLIDVLRDCLSSFS